MSITFYITNYDKTVRVNMLERYPALGIEDFENDPYVIWENGIPYEDEPAPETCCNFCNDNAYSVLRLLGIERSACGIIDYEAIPTIRRRILCIINNESEMETEVREPYEIKPTTKIVDDKFVKEGCSVYGCGTNLESIKRRIKELDTVLSNAQKLNKPVSWA